MQMEHILLEVYLEDSFDLEDTLLSSNRLKELVEKNIKFTIAENEIAFVGKNGIVKEVDDSIGFGGDMDVESTIDNYSEIHDKLLQEWEDICRKKIDEAYDEYMKKKNEIVNKINGIN